MGYFLARGMTRDFSFRQTKPGIEVSVEPRMAHGGYELALDLDGDITAGPRTYWGVADADVALQRLLEAGATIGEDVRDVGDGIRVATARDPAGSLIGIIENPHFAIVEAQPGLGPGR
jgi:predicted enzyme related to lactoylglutathione lyase